MHQKYIRFSKQISVKMPWEEHRLVNNCLESNIEKIYFKTVRIWVIPPNTAQKKCKEVHKIIIDNCQSTILKTAGTSPMEEVGKFQGRTWTPSFHRGCSLTNRSNSICVPPSARWNKKCPKPPLRWNMTSMSQPRNPTAVLSVENTMLSCWMS